MDVSKSLPFGIDFVVENDLAKFPDFKIWHENGQSFDITCPFCGGKKKMNVNTVKNVARCNKCGGNTGYNAISLHAALLGISNSESYRDLMNLYHGGKVQSPEREISEKKKAKDPTIPANLTVRNAVYQKFLSLLSLSDEHRRDLSQRGLSEEEIEKGMYRTVPGEKLHSLAVASILETGAFSVLSRHPSWGIPGFSDVQSRGKMCVRQRKNGYFIPVRTQDGRISGMQIRYDNPKPDATEEEKEDFRKYTWFSSSESETGCSVSGCENIHFAGNWKETPQTVNLSEGVLKADVASALSGKPFLGLAGVSNIGKLRSTLSVLFAQGSKKVNIYVDMDYREKKEVALALESIKKEISAAGKHRFLMILNRGKKAKLTEDPEGGSLSFSFESPIPKDCEIYLGKMKLQKKEMEVKGETLCFKKEFLMKIRNCRHTLAIVTRKDDRMILFSEITFVKTGLSYEVMEWDPRYKGIDDYYLSTKQIEK